MLCSLSQIGLAYGLATDLALLAEPSPHNVLQGRQPSPRKHDHDHQYGNQDLLIPSEPAHHHQTITFIARFGPEILSRSLQIINHAA